MARKKISKQLGIREILKTRSACASECHMTRVGSASRTNRPKYMIFASIKKLQHYNIDTRNHVGALRASQYCCCLYLHASNGAEHFWRSVGRQYKLSAARLTIVDAVEEWCSWEIGIGDNEGKSLCITEPYVLKLDRSIFLKHLANERQSRGGILTARCTYVLLPSA